MPKQISILCSEPQNKRREENIQNPSERKFKMLPNFQEVRNKYEL